jgi:hypothetical protein
MSRNTSLLLFTFAGWRLWTGERKCETREHRL